MPAVPIILAASAAIGAGATVYGAVDAHNQAEDAQDQISQQQNQQRDAEKKMMQQQKDADAKEAAIRNRDQALTRKRALTANAGGRRGTILTSPLGLTDSGQQQKTLLGM